LAQVRKRGPGIVRSGFSRAKDAAKKSARDQRKL
jgi:hypothetical protein